jgi:hypothetical protein
MGKKSRFILKPFAGLSSRFWGSFLLASTLAMSMEIASEMAIESNRHPSLEQSIFDMTGLYQRIVGSARNPIPRYTEIVSIDPSKEKHSIPDSHNVCGQRDFLARLVERIATAAPDVIVIDKDFLPGECEESSNKLLITTLGTVSQTVPIVVGRTLVESRKADTVLGAFFGTVEETESFHFRLPEGSLFYEGIASLDPDTRRLPLAWPSGEPTEWESIALKAARAHDPKFVIDRPRLQKLLLGQPPFISFLGGFEEHPSLEVLCDAPIADADSWRCCVKENPSPQELIGIARKLSFLRSRIVVVGEVSDEDKHESVLGPVPVPGFLLQANFIEALLDDRYYGPACWADYVLGFILFILLELILAREESIWRLILELGLLIFAAVVCLFVLVLMFQIYVNPVPVSAIAIVVKFGGFFSDRIQSKHIRKELAPVHVGRSIAYIAATIFLISAWTVLCPGPRRIQGRAVTVGNADSSPRPITM